jgi:hypothetical protein
VAICNGRGDTDGGHCCWINGKVCEFLVEEDGTPRCSIWKVNMKKSFRWRDAPVGRMFAVRFPGYDCKDWPQNIPNPETLGGLCCWEGKL